MKILEEIKEDIEKIKQIENVFACVKIREERYDLYKEYNMRRSRVEENLNKIQEWIEDNPLICIGY